MKFEFELPQFNQFKEHVKRNKTAYLIGSYVVVAGVVFYVTRKTMGPSVINNTVAPVFNNNNSSSVVNFGGHTTKIVKRMSDGKVWETVTDAADEAGTTLHFMSRHLNGWKPDVFGETYKIVGVGTTG